ncbi:MAG: hypothetical protein P8J02_09010 [Yoonia sp.]|nr:hypothetical protein [Yoonia sp.]
MAKLDDDIEIKDLVDFYERWPELRKHAVEMQSAPHLAEEKTALLEWMIMVIDRVGPSDLAPEKEVSNV